MLLLAAIKCGAVEVNPPLSKLEGILLSCINGRLSEWREWEEKLQEKLKIMSFLNFKHVQIFDKV